MVTVASNEPSRAVIKAQLGMALASLRPPRPRPTQGTGAVSGVRLSAASAPLATAIESPLLREGLQVVPGTSVASRCRHRHALAIEPMVLSADSRPSLLRHGGSPYPRREGPPMRLPIISSSPSRGREPFSDECLSCPRLRWRARVDVPSGLRRGGDARVVELRSVISILSRRWRSPEKHNAVFRDGVYPHSSGGPRSYCEL